MTRLATLIDPVIEALQGEIDLEALKTDCLSKTINLFNIL